VGRVKKQALRVSLNVKDPEAHRLAQAIAEETGESITHAVTQALRERHERLQHRRKKASVAEMLTIARRISSQIKGPYPDHGEDLYDEYGLPR
jgi:antitoxin VapB